MGRQAAPGHQNESEKEGPHAGTFRTFARRGKPRAPRGSFLIESTISLTILAVIGLLLLKMSMNVTAPRQWTVYQSLTDGYMTYEKAYAQRLSFAQIKAAGSPWPQSPSSATTTVEIGRLPGGVPVTGTVVRTRTADSNNSSGAGGTLNPTDYAALNPGKVEVWKLQSILTYVVNGRTYRKVKTIVRSQ